jgi:glucokinase
MGKYAIGVDLGGTKILAGLIDIETGQVLEISKKKTRKDQGSDYIVLKVQETVQKIIDRSKKKPNEILSIGIGAAGQVNRKEGILISAPNLDCTNIEFKKLLEQKFKIPVVLGNDVEVATIGEKHFGAGKGFTNFVCVFVGTGVGSGIVNKGEIYTGATGTAGEIGHLIVQPNGRLCGCGNNGCLEAYASRTAIQHRILASIKKGHPTIFKEFIDEDPNFSIRSKHIKLALEAGDEITTNCLMEAAEYLSQGLASVVNFYNPEKIILGGGLVEAVDFFFELVVKKVKSKCLPVPANSIEISRTTLGDYSGIVGAAIMADKRK